jgi:large subunit ribosomal protein L5
MSSDNKEKNMPRLLKLYREEIISKLKTQHGYSNSLAVPALKKIVVNMGVGAGKDDSKITDQCAQELAVITGQKAKICRSRKNISNFKLKKGVPIGCCVTIRRYRMYEFLDRLITVAIPRIRDFRGFSTHSFDGNGNYSFGLLEQSVFAELEPDKVGRTQGMTVSIQTSARTDEEAKDLLLAFGFPFRRV